MFNDIEINIDNSFEIEQELYDSIINISEDNFEEVKNNVVKLVNNSNYFKHSIECMMSHILGRRIKNPLLLILCAYVYKDGFIDNVLFSDKLKFVYVDYKKISYEINILKPFRVLLDSIQQDIIKVINKVNNKLIFEIKNFTQNSKIGQEKFNYFIYFVKDKYLFDKTSANFDYDLLKPFYIDNIDYDELKKVINDKLIFHYDYNYEKFYYNDIIDDNEDNEKILSLRMLSTIKNDDVDYFSELLAKKYDENIYNNRFYNIDINIRDIGDMNPQDSGIFAHGFNLIQIAELYGSIKIFKYLYLLNKFEISDIDSYYIIFGRNIEILKIIENDNKINYSCLLKSVIANKRNNMIEYCFNKLSLNNYSFINDIILQAITTYNYEGFTIIMDYLEENEYLKNLSKEDRDNIIGNIWVYNQDFPDENEYNIHFSFIIYIFKHYNKYFSTNIINRFNDIEYIADESDYIFDRLELSEYKPEEFKEGFYNCSSYFTNPYYEKSIIDDNLINWVLNNIKTGTKIINDQRILKINNILCDVIGKSNESRLNKINYIEGFKIRLLYDICLYNEDYKTLKHYLKLLFNKEYIDEIDLSYSFIDCYTFINILFKQHIIKNNYDKLKLFSNSFYNNCCYSKYININKLINDISICELHDEFFKTYEIKLNIVKTLHEYKGDESIIIDELIQFELINLNSLYSLSCLYSKHNKYPSFKYFNYYIKYLIDTYNFQKININKQILSFCENTLIKYISFDCVDKQVLNLLKETFKDKYNNNFVDECLKVL